MLPSANNQIQILVKNAHVLAFDVVFAQLKQKLLEIPKLKVYIEPILHLVLLLLFFLPFPLYLSSLRCGKEVPLLHWRVLKL